MVFGLPSSAVSTVAASQVIAWGDSATATNQVLSEFAGVVQISAGLWNNLGVNGDRTPIGRLVNSTTPFTFPSEATNLTSVAVSPYYYEMPGYSLALRGDGIVISLGYHNQRPAPLGHDYNTPPPAGLSNVVAIAPGLSHALALRREGSVVAWGNDSTGETKVPADLTNVIAIAAGEYYSLAVRTDGKVIAWGGYDTGATNVPSNLTNAVAVGAGRNHAVALRADGTVAAWGGNQYGELNVPKGLSNVVAVAVAWSYNLALKSDGTVVGWGANGGHNLDIPAGLTNITGISAGSYSLALMGDGPPFFTTAQPDLKVNYGTPVRLRMEASGAYPLHYQWKLDGTDLPGATNAILELPAINLGQAGKYSLTVGNIFGSITSSEMTLSVAPLVIKTQPRSQSTYRGASVIFNVDASGEPPVSYQWKLNGAPLAEATHRSLVLTNLQYSQAGIYSVIISNPFVVLASSNATLDVGQVAAWGNNDFAQATLPSGLTNVVAISAGGIHSLALSSEGRVLVWGDHQHGQSTNVPGVLEHVISIAAGGFHNLALKADGTVAAWGDNSYGQINVPPLTNVVAVAGGLQHSLALKADGKVVAWGGNFNGQTNVPEILTNVVMISAGFYHNLALKDDGTVIAWGANSNGQTNAPSDLTGVVAVSAGGTHSCALTDDGQVIAWGNDLAGQSRVPADLSPVVQISAGGSHSMALTAENSIVAWGNSNSGRTNAPSDLRNIVAIAAGANHNLALLDETPLSLQAFLSNPVRTVAAFEVSFPSRSGKVYRLEYKSLLTDPVWIPLPLAPGTGRILTLTDFSGTSSSRFYRVRQW